MSRRGLSLVEVIIASGVLGLLGMAIATLFLNTLKLQQNFELKSSLTSLQSSIRSTIQDEASWLKTVQNPGGAAGDSLSCLRDLPYDCSSQFADAAKPFQLQKLLSASGLTIVDGSSAGNGFTAKGERCDSYDEVDGNDACPIRVKVTWEPLTSSTLPTVAVQAKFEYKPKTFGLALNIAKYNFTEKKPGVVNSVESSCESLGGTFDSTTNTCSLPPLGSCPDGSIVTGFNSDGSKICKKINTLLGADCPEGQMVVGFDKDGKQICKNVLGGECPDGSIVVGFNEEGKRICDSLPKTLDAMFGTDCPVGSFIVGINKNGSRRCKVADTGEDSEQSLADCTFTDALGVTKTYNSGSVRLTKCVRMIIPGKYLCVNGSWVEIQACVSDGK